MAFSSIEIVSIVFPEILVTTTTESLVTVFGR